MEQLIDGDNAINAWIKSSVDNSYEMLDFYIIYTGILQKSGLI